MRVVCSTEPPGTIELGQHARTSTPLEGNAAHVKTIAKGRRSHQVVRAAHHLLGMKHLSAASAALARVYRR